METTTTTRSDVVYNTDFGFSCYFEIQEEEVSYRVDVLCSGFLLPFLLFQLNCINWEGWVRRAVFGFSCQIGRS